MAFQVGQKVVCVDDGNWSPHFWDQIRPKNGAVYTIRSFRKANSIRLEEIVNAPKEWRDGYNECGFLLHRFRPLVERKTDISIFTAMLNPSKQTVDAH